MLDALNILVVSAVLVQLLDDGFVLIELALQLKEHKFRARLYKMEHSSSSSFTSGSRQIT